MPRLYKPEGAVVITTWLKMPTGYYIYWEGRLSPKIILTMLKVSDDLDLAREDPSVKISDVWS